jgi:murein DD-endopeptidase MepM/ murein hydrolase activator NlpD
MVQFCLLHHRIRAFAFLVFFISSAVCNAQQSLIVPRNYEKGYFMWPVGAKIGLAANFGELRPNHYHMGLDCRTDQVENKKVFAAADGYISRIKIEPFGFGRSISINHPNGMTTLYAHLNAFDPKIEAYLKKKQYQLKTWELTLDIPPGELPVVKGDFLAFSGNTGGSQGPHLHFEVRDTKTEKVLNPLLMGFPVNDNIPPSILRLAVYDRRLSTYDQTPKIYPAKFTKAGYHVASGKIMVSSDKISFAITAFDRYTGSTNHNGIYAAELIVDGIPVSSFQLDSISYDETRYLNAHIDYKTRANGGPYLQHLSKLPGYDDGIYHCRPGQDGVITLSDSNPHEIRIRVLDTNNNESVLNFTVQRTAGLSAVPSQSGSLFIPNQANVFEHQNLVMYLPEKSLYDSFHFKFSEVKNEGQPGYQLQNNTVPVHSNFPVMIRPDNPFNDITKLVMKRYYNTKKDFKKADFFNGWYRSTFREFGIFQLIYDTIPPTVTAPGFVDGMNAAKLHSIRFSVKDENEEIGSFEATLDGNWLRFSNDKARLFIYEFDEKCPPGEHELKIVVKDLVGNQTEKSFRFTR